MNIRVCDVAKKKLIFISKFFIKQNRTLFQSMLSFIYKDQY